MPEKRKICLVYAVPQARPEDNNIYAVLWQAHTSIVIQAISQTPFGFYSQTETGAVIVFSREHYALRGADPHTLGSDNGEVINEMLKINDAELSLNRILWGESREIKVWDENLARQQVSDFFKRALEFKAPPREPKFEAATMQ